ncbi:zf-HC2 domain-containing protein [Clostridium sp. C2-6-12]|uniref:zf-HC2 domain-containing protein n=1 Tax=Clostridium sp. C2-6-12 TaxID=2698832 RepID=UPI001371DC73|nr:zf-HC2 domain-containing protein [Clostridium sp. C2-6-12]
MKYDCEVIRDLLPIYKDGIANKKSNEVIEEHFKECKACEEYYNDLNKAEIDLPEPIVIENQNVVNYGKRVRKKIKIAFILVASIIAFLLFVITFMWMFFTGGFPTKTSNIKDYGSFKDFKGYSNLYIFPKEIPKSAKVDSYYYYHRDTLFDPTCQIYLEYSLSKTDFDAEVLRLSKICESYENQNYKDKVNNIVYDTKNFMYPAYVTIFNRNHCYEYALLDNEEHKIIYVFTQFIELKNVNFDKKYLPVDFGKEKSSKGYNMYYSGNDFGYFERHKR